MGLQSSILTNQKKVQFALSTRAVCLCLRFFESFLHRQAKELFNYWQKPTQTRLKKGEKRAKTREFRFSFLFTFLHFFFSYAVAQEHCMFCGGAFCAWRRIASLVFLQRTLICVLGKRCIGSLSVCK